MPKKRAYRSRRLTGEGDPTNPGTLETEGTSLVDGQNGAEGPPITGTFHPVGETSLDGCVATYPVEGGETILPPNTRPLVTAPPAVPAHSPEP